MTEPLKICNGCGARGHWPIKPHRATRCDSCRLEWERQRNARRRARKADERTRTPAQKP